jgi:hypothetical protein
MSIRGLLLALAVSIACSSDALALYIRGIDLNSWIQAAARIAAGNPQVTDYQAATLLQGYVLGVDDSWDLEQDLSMCKLHVVGQLVAVVTQYVEAHPEKWGQSGVVVRRHARGAFPPHCPAPRAARATTSLVKSYGLKK